MNEIQPPYGAPHPLHRIEGPYGMRLGLGGNVTLRADANAPLALGFPPERTPDGDAQVWLLFGPGLFTLAPQLNHWTTPCTVWTSQAAATSHLAAMLGEPLASSLTWTQHPLFPDLFMATDSRGWRWLLCAAPVDVGVR